MRQIISFLISGGVSAAGEYTCFLLLTYIADSSVVVSQLISFGVGMIISFSLNKFWVFKSSRSYKRELPQYVALALINAVLGAAIISLLTGALSLAGWAAKLIVMAMIATWNFVLMQRIIFRERGA